MSDFAGHDPSDRSPGPGDQDRLHRLDLGLAEFGRRVHQIGDEDWDRPTPDADWTVRDLVAHLIDEHRWAPPLMAGHDLDAAALIVHGQRGTDRPGDDWDDVALLSRRAFGEPGALDRDVSLSGGPTSARHYLAEMTMELAVHSWDLGTALGEDVELPADLVRGADDHVGQLGDLSASPMFDPPVEVGPDASPTDRLVARTGRRPEWTA
ncbi:MAG: TIGR03086 family metal-binding protein [bacterium]